MRHADPLLQLVGRGLQAVLIVQLVAAIGSAKPLLIFLTLSALLVSLGPIVLRGELRAQLAIESQIAVAALALGVMFWADASGHMDDGPAGWHFIAHTGSGLVLGMVAVLAAVDLLSRRRLRVTPFLAAIYAIALGIAAITVWEIFEYVMEFTGANGA
jgi:hypothetical protein